MTTEVRIVRDIGAGMAASGNLDPVTLAYLPPKAYPRGVITLPATFDKPGKYAVLVTVRDAQDMAMSGRLGLTVGEGSRQWIFVYILSGIILAAAFGFYLRDLGRNKGCPSKAVRPPSGVTRACHTRRLSAELKRRALPRAMCRRAKPANP